MSSSPLADLSWLSGTWVGETPGQYLEEHWALPRGNSMVGYFRWLRGDTLWITEHLSITEEVGGVYFRLRHFSNRMRAWESDDDPFLYRLMERDMGLLLFEAEEARTGRPLRFIFRTVPGDSLSFRLEGERDGQPEVQEFRFGRRSAP